MLGLESETANELTIDDIIADPSKFGAPTFEEYSRNPEKWRGREDELLQYVDKGSTAIRGVVKNHKYECFGYKCKNLEEVESIARNHGCNINDLDYTAEWRYEIGTKGFILVRFFDKQTKARRDAW